eukprot:3933101-Rhodomonas_salina.1
MSCEQNTYTSSGNGYELPERAKHWCDGPLVSGTATLHELDTTLSFYQVKDGSVVFPFGKGDWTVRHPHTHTVSPACLMCPANRHRTGILTFSPLFSDSRCGSGPCQGWCSAAWYQPSRRRCIIHTHTYVDNVGSHTYVDNVGC